jgi:hypothetical protein
MPGRHAPASPRSFYLSVARSVGGSLAAVALMAVAVFLVLDHGGQEPKGFPTVAGSPTTTTTPTARPTASRTPAAPSPSVLPASKVTVDVRNGTTRAGLAAKTADRVRAAGYPVLKVGNEAPLAQSTIFYRPDSLDEAKAFQRRFPEFSVLKASTTNGAAILRVVIGADFP